MNNNPSKPCGPCGQKFPQPMVNQQPVYDRKLKVTRPRKKKGMGPKWL